MKKSCFLYAGLLAATILAAGSCRKAEERRSERIRLEAVERIEPLGPTRFEAVVRVKNATRHRLGLEAAELTVYCGANRAGTLVLEEPVEVPGRTTGSFDTRWRLKIADPLVLYALVRKVQAGEFGSIGVSYAAQGRGGPVPVNISRERMPLSEFLNTFDLDSKQLKTYFQE